MSRKPRALEALLTLASLLLLGGCQPVLGALEQLAERNNAQLADHERVAEAKGLRAEDEAPAAANSSSDEAEDASAEGAQGDPAAAELASGVDADGGAGSGMDSGDPDGSAGQGSDPRRGPPVVYAEAVASRTPPPAPTADPFAGAGNPQRLEIPAIQVDASIEQVGLTSQGAMDVPKGWMNAAWYQLGVRPGEPGNAVIAGHLDSSTGGPAVFWDLNLLQPGDLVHVTYENGERLTFAVETSQIYQHDADTQVIESIFGPGQTADLNLITCMGPWDYGSATYAERLVVFSRLVEDAP